MAVPSPSGGTLNASCITNMLLLAHFHPISGSGKQRNHATLHCPHQHAFKAKHSTALLPTTHIAVIQPAITCV
jgi:hypothetical protein